MLQLTLPGNFKVDSPPGFGTGQFKFVYLGDFVSAVLYVMFFLAGAFMFAWFTWGAFQYILAGGQKESLAKARARMTYAIIGFVIVILAFFLSEYVRYIFPDRSQQQIQRITYPDPEFNAGFTAVMNGKNPNCQTDACRAGVDAANKEIQRRTGTNPAGP